MSKEKKSINRIVVFNVLSTVLIQGVTFFSAPFFSRFMGTSNYGIYSVYGTWVSIVTVVFGLQTNASVGVAIKDYNKDEQKKYQSSIYSLSIVSYVGCSIVIVLFIKQLSGLMQLEPVMLVLILIQGFCTMTISFINNVFTMEYKAEKNMVLSVTSVLGGIILSFVLFCFIPSEVNYYARIMGCLCVDFVITLVLCINLFMKGRCFYNKNYWKYCIPIAIPMVFHALSGIILNQSDRVIIQNMLDSSSAGIYSLSFAFSTAVSCIYIALNNSFVPFYYEYLNNEDEKVIKTKCQNYMSFFTVVIIGFLMLSPEVFGVFASDEFLQGRSYIPLFCLGTFFIFLYSFSVNYEIYMKKTRIVAIATAVTAVINIVLNVVLIKLIGVMGVVLATVISDFLQYVIHYIASIKVSPKKKHPVSFKTQLPYIIVVLLVTIICFFIENRFAVVRWIIGIGLGIAELFIILKRKSIF